MSNLKRIKNIEPNILKMRRGGSYVRPQKAKYIANAVGANCIRPLFEENSKQYYMENIDFFL